MITYCITNRHYHVIDNTHIAAVYPEIYITLVTKLWANSYGNEGWHKTVLYNETYQFTETNLQHEFYLGKTVKFFFVFGF